MSQTFDYADWLTKQQAADAIGVTTKTVERFVQSGQIQQARWQPEGRGPMRAVYHPGDVARVAAERRQGPLPPFLVPVGVDPPTNGNGHGGLSPINPISPLTELAIPDAGSRPGEDLLRVLVAAAVRVMSETSQTSTLFLTIPEAAAYAGLPATDIRRACESGELKARKTTRGAWRIRRTDLEQL